MAEGIFKTNEKRQAVTLLLMSDRKGVARRWVLSVVWIKAAIAIGVVLVVLLAAILLDYAGLLFQAIENKRLKAENAQLRNQFRTVENKLDSLEAGLERIRTFTTKLKLITDVGDDDRGLKLAVGPDGKPQDLNTEYGEPMEERGPAGTLARDDSLFLSRPPLEAKSGELAINKMPEYATLSIRIERTIKESSLREQGVLELLELLSDRQSLLKATPSILPARGWITSAFGYRTSPMSGEPLFHQGLDIAAAPGTPIHAPADGVVSFVDYDSGYGKMVSIDHGYGIVTRYGHNSQIFVNQGQRVKRGEVIAQVGNTGRSTGPHLHYEVRLNDVPVDPMNYILTE